MGSFFTKGKETIVAITKTTWKRTDSETLLYIGYLLVSEIRATLENPDPDSLPMISMTLP